jgi:hypothetical protein
VENIGDLLSYYKFPTLVNPYGVLFHPQAIAKLLQDVKYQKTYTKKDLIQDQGLWHSPYHHSDFSHVDPAIVIQKINECIQHTKQFLTQTSHVVFTLGTAWVYHYIERDTLVANCHKIPQNQFLKRLLSLDEIKENLNEIFKLTKELSPKAEVIFTVSPVRHLKDGFQENMRSKALLLVALNEFILKHKAYYFPSYEIMTDDLRDYRFYDADLLHPNETAIKYIWDIFEKTWIDSNSYPVMKKVMQVQKGLSHKPFHPDTESHKQFLKQLKQWKEELQNNYQIEF